MNETKKAPKHLKPDTRQWWESVNSTYDLEDHHRRLLTLAAESWDRCTEAREAIAEHGLTYDDRFGKPSPRPEIAVERDSRIAFARLIRELALDVCEPGAAEVRPPSIRGNAGRKVG